MYLSNRAILKLTFKLYLNFSFVLKSSNLTGASSVLAIVSRCAGYSATVCLDEKMTRVIVGVPRYVHHSRGSHFPGMSIIVGVPRYVLFSALQISSNDEGTIYHLLVASC